MKFLFIFAHPDDETVACAGTIKQLIEAGHQVSLVLATDGGAGEVSEAAQEHFKKCKSVSKLRQEETDEVVKHLGITDFQYLNFEDGEINNKTVWAKLTTTMIDIIDSKKPDFVVTFDHTGWYFHLDHVGVSIATTIAFNKAEHKSKGLLLSHFRPDIESKWHYIFPQNQNDITHQVQVKDVKHKLAAFDKHLSQNLETPRKYIENQKQHFEYYQLANAQGGAEEKLVGTGVFERK